VNRGSEIGIAIGIEAGIHVSVSVGISGTAECALNSIYPRLDADARVDARADADVFSLDARAACDVCGGHGVVG
jgi:hypothetical protein